MELQTNVSFNMTAVGTKDRDVAQDSTTSVIAALTKALQDGTGDDQANQVYSQKVTLNAGNSYKTTLDLGALTDYYGDSVDFSKIKAILIENISDVQDPAQTGIATVMVDEAANEFKGPLADVAGDYIAVKPGDYLWLFSPKEGWTVDATHDQFNLGVTTSTDCTLNVVLIGVV